MNAVRAWKADRPGTGKAVCGTRGRHRRDGVRYDSLLLGRHALPYPKGLRGSADFNGGNFGVQCQLAPDQRLLAGTLKGRDKVRLVGTVHDINTGGVVLGDCRQVR